MPCTTGCVLAVTLASFVLVPSALASTARIAWFYKPPTDGSSAAAVASATTGQMVLTKRDEAFRNELRAAGYAAPILQYVESAYVHGPSGARHAAAACDATFAPWANNVAWNAGDFCRYVHANEDWFLHNGRGERLVDAAYTGGHGVFYAMNPASAGWRQFFARRLREALVGDGSAAPLGYDGLFLDDVWLTRRQLLHRVANADGVVRELASDADWQAAVSGFLRVVREAASGRPVHANTDGNDAFGAVLDGTMREDFAASWNGTYMDAAAVLDLWRMADRAAAGGKSLLLAAQGRRDDTARMRYAFAAYLMVAGPHVCFRYTQDASAYRERWTYPEYSLDLGAPTDARNLAGGSTWRRTFAKGVALVNLSASAPQMVNLGGVHATVDGTLTSTVVLPPRTGTTLTKVAAGARRVNRAPRRPYTRAKATRSPASGQRKPPARTSRPARARVVPAGTVRS